MTLAGNPTKIDEEVSTAEPTPEPAGASEPDAPAQSAALARYDADASTLRVPTNIPGLVLSFTKGQGVLDAQQMHMLAPLGIEAGWDPAQVAVFLLQCQVRGMDPWRKHAYLLRIDGRYVYHAGIGGLLAKAESTGQFRGLTQPQWCGPDGQWRDVWLDKTTAPSAARIGVLRDGFDAPVWGVATYEEYAPLVNETAWDAQRGKKVSTGRRRPAANWRTAVDGGKPGVMLLKCAKAAALRDAFPDDCGGFYVSEETEKMRAEARERSGGVERDDTATERRQAAYAQAMDEAATEPAPEFAGHGVTDDEARQLLLAELDEQAAVLGRTRHEVVANWVAARGGVGPDQWPLQWLASAVRALRRYVLAELRERGETAEADHYQAAPDVGTVEQLFGRGPVVLTGATVVAQHTDYTDPWEQAA